MCKEILSKMQLEHLWLSYVNNRFETREENEATSDVQENSISGLLWFFCWPMCFNGSDV